MFAKLTLWWTKFFFHLPTFLKCRRYSGGRGCRVGGNYGLYTFSLVSLWTFLWLRSCTLEQQHSVSSVVNQQLLEPHATQGPALQFIFKQSMIPPHHFHATGRGGGNKSQSVIHRKRFEEDRGCYNMKEKECAAGRLGVSLVWGYKSKRDIHNCFCEDPLELKSHCKLDMKITSLFLFYEIKYATRQLEKRGRRKKNWGASLVIAGGNDW